MLRAAEPQLPTAPSGYPDTEWVFLGVLSGQALLAELFGTTSLRDPASLEGICCPNSLDKIQPSGSGVLGEASPVGAMIRRERPLEQGLDVLLPIPPLKRVGSGLGFRPGLGDAARSLWVCGGHAAGARWARVACAVPRRKGRALPGVRRLLSGCSAALSLAFGGEIKGEG